MLTIAFAVQTKGVWISKDNLASVFQVTATLGIMALGEALVITVREIDISVGSTFGIGALVYLGAAQFISPWAAVAGAILAGSAIGAINGLLVTRLKVNALVATLGTLFVFRGLCYALTEGFSFSAGDELTGSWAYAIFGGGEIFGIKNSLIWLLLIAAILHVIVFTTRSGNWLLAVGGDEPSALSRGVRTDAVKLVAFVAAATLAALAGVLEDFEDRLRGRFIWTASRASSDRGLCHRRLRLNRRAMFNCRRRVCDLHVDGYSERPRP